MAICLSVKNMAELRHVTSLEGMVNVKGFSSIGDGGGGNFIWDQYSPDEDNNGTIIRPNKQPPDTDGRWIRQFSDDINVRWFGAKGDTKGIAGEYIGTVSVSGTTGELIAKTPVFSPEDRGKIIMIWDSNAIEKPLAAPSKPYVITIDSYVNDYTVKFTVEMNDPPTRTIDNMCFAWGTNDNDAVQAAWDATTKIFWRVLSYGTAPPRITITGTANQCVILKIIATKPGPLGIWQFKYSTDNGTHFSDEIKSAATESIISSADKTPTGLTLHIDPGIASLDNIWSVYADTNAGHRLIFPSGTYNVTTLTSRSMPSAYLEGIGKVIITSPNSLGDLTKVNQIIKFTTCCGPAYITNMIFQGISTSDAGIVQYSDGTSAILPSPFNAAGNLGPFNQRVGIYYQGTDAIICKNVEVSNMPCAGLLIDYGVGQSLIENSYFHANGLYNIKVFPGERVTLDETTTKFPEIQNVTRVKDSKGGSIKLIRTRIEDSIPVAYGYLSYGVEVGGCDFTAIDCDFVNNAGAGIGNDDVNPSTMTIDNCRFAFGNNNGKLSFPRTLTSPPGTLPPTASVKAGENTVDINPFPSPGSVQGAPGISMPDVLWSLEGPLVSHGTGGPGFLPNITITGTTATTLERVILKIICTSPGPFKTWKFKYSTDNGITWSLDILSKDSVPIETTSLPGPPKPTGLTLHIDDTHKATVGDLWIADNTYSQCSLWKKGDTTITTLQKADTSSKIGNTSLSWVVADISSLLTVGGSCQNFSCTNCLFKGADATAPQLSAIFIKGHEFGPTYDHTYHRTIESQRVVKMIGNTFDTFSVVAIIYLRTWTTKEIKIQNNVFVDSPFSQCIIHDPSPDTSTSEILPFNKKAISKIIHVSGNTYVDVGRVYLSSGGLIEINDERVIYTGKSYFPTIPYTPPILSIPPIPTAQYFPATEHFYISTRLGRVGRVIRRNNTISGQIASKLYNPGTTPPTLTAAFPTWWSWHEGDREEIDIFPVGTSYFSYGFLGYTSIKAGHENELKFKKFATPSATPGRFADRFQAGAEISMMYLDSGKLKNVTWGGGFPYVVLTYVDRTKTHAGDVCAKTALRADNAVDGAEVFAPFYYGGSICMVPGTFGGTCTAHATITTTSPFGKYYKISIDDVYVLRSRSYHKCTV